jgi:glycosyltransferase involved in cell wall biosynthesis
MARARVSVITSSYRSESYLREFLEAVPRQTVFSQLELVLIHNEPSPRELSWVRGFQRDHPGVLRHLIVDDVEPLSTSWNRGIRAARGGYVCLWNVDDMRTDDSIELQASALDSHPDVLLAYGSFVMVGSPRAKQGTAFDLPAFDTAGFLNSYQCGPFPMWRKSVHERVGVFDEQLLSGADYDMVCRIALSGPLMNVGEPLGFFLNIGEGLSTGSDLAHVEDDVIKLRYGMSDCIDTRYLRRALRYRVRHLLQEGAWCDVRRFVPGYDQLVRGSSRRLVLGLRRNFVRRFPRFAAIVVRVSRRVRSA